MAHCLPMIVRAATLLFLCLCAQALYTIPAFADTASEPFFRCDVPTAGAMSDPRVRDEMRFDAALDAYHGVLFVGAGGAIGLASSPTRRWSGTNSFDTGIREGLRGGSTSARQDADLASDFTLAISIGVLPALSIGSSFARNHDCLEAWDMTSDWIESFGLTLMVTNATKVIAGRDRPFVEDCGDSSRRDAGCGNDDRHASFFSGHSSLAAAGAGLTCSFSLGRQAWGSSRHARVAPCALGVMTALATGALRITADRHWGSDVLVGFAAGALIGYFDTWGPLDVLRFRTRDASGRMSSSGMFLPFAREGRIGAQLNMIF